jgi:hypothetical protein
MIRKKREQKELVIDLTGPDGNVFVLMGYARQLSRHVKDLYEEEMHTNREQNRILLELGLADTKAFPENLADQVIAEMTSSDYENAVQVFDRYFGSFVILER